MDRTTLAVMAAAAALLMFALGWTACWLWFRLRMPYAAAPNDPSRPARPDAVQNAQQALEELNRLEAEFAGDKAKTPDSNRQQLQRDAFDRPV